MSDILEALRKVELQRSNTKVPGISTHQRYYTAKGKLAWSSPAVLVTSALIGVSLSGALAAYLTQEGSDNTPTATVAKPLQQSQQKAVHPSASAISDGYRGAQSAMVAQSGSIMPHQATLQSTKAAPVRLPGPRQKATGQSENEKSISQTDHQAEKLSMQDESGQTPAEETRPEPEKPMEPDPGEKSAVANGNKSTSMEAKPSKSTEVPLERTAYSRIQNPADALDRIRPPLAVEVKPYRPNDVIRPPASRKAPASNANSQAPLLSTLSSQFQSMVPKMAINAQVYSDMPKDRFVVINMKRYNEGQNTAEGVAVESIRQDDIVLSYQGQRFRIGR